MSPIQVDGITTPGQRFTVVETSFIRPNDTNAYAAGDAVTDSTTSPTAMTFAQAARRNGGSGTIVGAILASSYNQATKGEFELWLFDTAPTPDNDNAAFTPTDTELGKLVGVVDFALPYVGDATVGAGGNCVYQSGALNFPFRCLGGADDLYGLIVARNAYTPGALEVFKVRLMIIQD